MSSTTTPKATKKVTKKRVTSTPSSEPVVETTATIEEPIQIEAPEIKKRKVTKKVVKTASKETKEIKKLTQSSASIESSISTETVVVEDIEQSTQNVQNEEEKICQSFTEQVTLNNHNDQSTSSTTSAATSTTTTAVVDVLELGVSERDYTIPDNVIAPSKHKNNPNNFYLFNDLEIKTRNKQPLSTLEFQQLLKGLRSLNQTGFNMVYLLIRTFSIQQKNQTNLFDIPFKGKINNQSLSTYDIEYDLTELPAQLQHILLLFTNKHLQVMKEDKQQTHQTQQTQQMVVSTAAF